MKNSLLAVMALCGMEPSISEVKVPSISKKTAFIILHSSACSLLFYITDFTNFKERCPADMSETSSDHQDLIFRLVTVLQ